jgi:hypothetical protein
LRNRLWPPRVDVSGAGLVNVIQIAIRS